MVLLLAAVLLKSLLWINLVPIFQTPDEQAHFAQLQWYAEKKTTQIDPVNNLSLEEATAEDILGTRRDERGNNKYTYHPEYKNNSPVPVMPIVARTTYVGQEAAVYPPLYYDLSVPFYNAVYSQNLVNRVMAARILPVILNLLLAAVAFKIGKLIWEDNLFAFSLGIIVSFQPMISYVSAGIHPDNLLNLLYSLGILILLFALKKGFSWKLAVVSAATLFLGMQTKQFMIFFLPVAVAVFVYLFFKRKLLGIILAAGVLLSPIAAFLLRIPIPYMPGVGPAGAISFLDYLHFRVGKLAFEMWPWYWGVFKWLGVTLPPMVMKIITRVAVLAALGLVIKILLAAKNWKITFELKALIFFLLSSAFYLIYLVFWDWRLMQSTGFSLGLQGRYLFPNIIPQMALLLAGITALFGRWKKIGAILSATAMVALNVIAMQLVFNIYH